MNEWKQVDIVTDRTTANVTFSRARVRQSNWAVILEFEDGEMWINKHNICLMIITECEEDDD